MAIGGTVSAWMITDVLKPELVALFWARPKAPFARSKLTVISFSVKLKRHPQDDFRPRKKTGRHVLGSTDAHPCSERCVMVRLCPLDGLWKGIDAAKAVLKSGDDKVLNVSTFNAFGGRDMG
jgi:hypothetical protein